MPRRQSVYQSKSCGSSRVTYLDRSQAIEGLRVQARRLVDSHPEVLEVRLFGSLARREAVPGSDADVLIVLRRHPLPRWFDRIPEFLGALQESGLPVEVFPYTLEELDQLESAGGGMVTEARRGLLLAREGETAVGSYAARGGSPQATEATVASASSINVSPGAIAEFCQRHHIRRLALFGSVLREDFGPDSDIDVLLEFEPGHMPGWEIVDLEEELSVLFGGRRVDSVNPRYLNHRLKDSILASAAVQYEAPDAA